MGVNRINIGAHSNILWVFILLNLHEISDKFPFIVNIIIIFFFPVVMNLNVFVLNFVEEKLILRQIKVTKVWSIVVQIV